MKRNAHISLTKNAKAPFGASANNSEIKQKKLGAKCNLYELGSYT